MQSWLAAGCSDIEGTAVRAAVHYTFWAEGVKPYCFLLPQLGMHQRVVVQYERLQVNQASHLRRQAVQLVVAQVQIQQVRQVDEQLVGDRVDAIVAQIQHQHVPAVLQVPGDLRQLIVAQVLNGEDGKSVGRR